jgi:hypothetical protein
VPVAAGRHTVAPPLPAIASAALLAAALLAPVPAEPATIRVPADQPTVRAAVGAAADRDTILIAPGIHPGGVYVRGKAVTIASWFLTTQDTTFIAQTVIDSISGDPCGGVTSCAGNVVLEFASDAGGSAVVGLTIRKGEDGVRSRAPVDVSWCHVLQNHDGIDYQGGGGGTIHNNLFSNNLDDAIDINGAVDITIRDNLVRDSHQDGIEFRMYPYQGPVKHIDVIGNRFIGNGGDGIQLIDYPDSSSRVIRIEHNLFSGNLDASVGCMPDGITGEDFSGAPVAERIYLVGNTFANVRYGFVGGANVVALNNIFTGAQVSALRRVRGSSIASYSLFWNNAIDDEESNVDLPHVLHADPMLGAAGAPAPGSPAIDAGTALFSWHGETVLDLPPTAYVGAAPDMGAFESGGGGPGVNARPFVSAGADVSVTLPAAVALDGTVTDDGLPNPPAAVTVTWAVVSGPGAVSFQDARAIDTQASFTAEGVYVLSLAASDGSLTTTDPVQVTVQPAGTPGGSGTIERRIAAGSDDAEESATGSVSLTSSDVELVYDGSNQVVGLRFPGLTIPRGAGIATAWVQFEADEAQSEATSLMLRGQAADDAATFASAGGNLSARPRTAASVPWAPPAWAVVSEAAAGQRTPELKSVIQEIVDRPGWASGHALAIVVTGSGHRTARAFEGKAEGAALLHVEFDGGAPATNLAPGVDAGPDRTITLPADAPLDGTVSDDGLPSPPGAVTTAWGVASGPGAVTFADPGAIDTRASFVVAGTYVLRLTAGDGERSAEDSMRVTVQPAPPPGPGTIERRIAAGSDDAEESGAGKVSTNNSDLELVFDRTNQRVGLRFTGVTIPSGATVSRAWVQFVADETQNEATSLVVQGQAADHAGAFTTALGNVSTRPRTVASVGWSPPAWTQVGEAGPGQRTPDLSAVLQEIVGRPGWASGNALALIVTGTGHRTAESYEGKAAAAPLLHVEYAVGAPASARRAETAVEAAPRVELALRASPNPTRGPLHVDLSLPGGEPATLELLDAAGRRLALSDVGALGPGRHRVALGGHLPAGIYFVRLVQAGRARVAKAMVLR